MNENNFNAPRKEQEEPRRRFPLTRATFLAIMSMLMTVAVAASLTFALFVETVPNQHVKIQAGDFDLIAKYVKLEGTMLCTDESDLANYGRLVSFSANESNMPELNFGDLVDNKEYIFDIKNAVPTLVQTATFELSNGGNVAFDYTFSIDPSTLKKSDCTEEEFRILINQLQVTITSSADPTNPSVFILSDILDPNKVTKTEFKGNLRPKLSTEAEPVPITITVAIEFLNDEDNNHLTAGDNLKAQGAGCTFDILIEATQTT